LPSRQRGPSGKTRPSSRTVGVRVSIKRSSLD
jgi:hypothetical protein